MMPAEQMEKAPCKSCMASRQSTMKRLPIWGTRPLPPSPVCFSNFPFHLCQFLCTADWESSQNNKAWGRRGLWLGSDRVQIDIWFFYLFTVIARGGSTCTHAGGGGGGGGGSSGRRCVDICEVGKTWVGVCGVWLCWVWERREAERGRQDGKEGR